MFPACSTDPEQSSSAQDCVHRLHAQLRAGKACPLLSLQPQDLLSLHLASLAVTYKMLSRLSQLCFHEQNGFAVYHYLASRENPFFLYSSTQLGRAELWTCIPHCGAVRKPPQSLAASRKPDAAASLWRAGASSGDTDEQRKNSWSCLNHNGKQELGKGEKLPLTGT